MTDSETFDRAVEKRLNTGLLNYWYPVLPSWSVSDVPVGITRLSQNLVIWRDRDGQIHVLEDRCPHRGARLSLGWNLSDRVACWYHGVEVDGTGTVKSVPASANCPIEGKQVVKSYPVQEREGAIFVFFGDEANLNNPPELVLPNELAHPEEFSGMLCTATWKCNYRFAIDNVMDPMHGAYLHAVSHSMGEGDKTAEMRIRKTEHGLMFEKTSQKGLNFDWTEFGETGTLWMRLAIPYQKKYGGGEFFINGFATPIDEDHCMVFFWRVKKAVGWERSTWRFLYRTRLEGLHWAVLEQDRMILEDMAPDPRSQEFLYQHDTGLARIRRLLETRAREQVQAAQQGRQAAE